MREALELERSYWQDGQFIRERIPLNSELPGRALWAIIPNNRKRNGPNNGGTGGTTTIDGVQVDTWENADDWESPFHFFSSDATLSDVDCDRKLSKIFGGNAKAMESAGDIDGRDRLKVGLGHSATPYNEAPNYPDGSINYQRGGIIHTYTDEKGSKVDTTALTTPGGWLGNPFPYYKGGNSGLEFKYPGGFEIEFVHIGTKNVNLIPSIPKNPRKQAIATIGFVGGAGGSSEAVSLSLREKGLQYTHTHIVFKRRGLTVDPRKLFCGW